MKKLFLTIVTFVFSIVSFAQSEYNTVTELNNISEMAISSSVSFSINDTIYFGTGMINPGEIDQSFIFKSCGDFETWLPAAAFPSVRNNAMSFVLNNEAYIVGGSHGTTRYSNGYKYNVSDNTWSAIADLPGGIYGGVSLVDDSCAYIITGSENNSFTRKIYKYSSDNNNWAELPSLPTTANPRVYAEGFSIENKLYVFGGAYGSSRLNDMYRFNSEDSTWTALGNLPIGLLFSSSFSVGKKGYAIAGRSSSENASNDIYEYTPETDTWRLLDDTIPADRILQFSTVMNNKAYFGGGTDNTNTSVAEFFSFYPHDSVSVETSICFGETIFLAGENQTNSGVYIDTLLNQYDQDSIVVTNLTVLPDFSTTESITLCEGDAYTFPDGITQENITEDMTYVSYLSTFESSCDSIVTTNITVGPAYDETEIVRLCEGDNYTFPDGAVETNIISNMTHVSSLEVFNSSCDSIITSNVVVFQNFTINETASVCFGESYTFPDGTTENGITSQIVHISYLLTVFTDCDSSIITTVNVKPIYVAPEPIQISSCGNFTSPGGNVWAVSGIYQDVLTGSSGCDSIINYDLTILESTTGVDIQTACHSYTWIDDIIYTSSNNTATYTLENAAGCDSVVTLNLTIDSVDIQVDEQDNVLTALAENANFQWLDCENENAIIPDETNAAFTPLSDGAFAVEVTQGDCVDTSDCFVVVGLESMMTETSNSPQVYPIPTKGNVTLILEEHLPADVLLYDIDGRLVLRKNDVNEPSIKLSIDGVNGIYVLEVRSKDTNYRYKLIKN